MENLVLIKGVRNRLVVKLPDSVVPDRVVSVIDCKLSEEDKAVWRNSSIILDAGKLLLSKENLKNIRKLFEDKYKMYLSELQSLSKDTLINGEKMGWPISAEFIDYKMVKPSLSVFTEPPNEKQNTNYIKKTVRSGSRVDSLGNVVVLGDVNPGAEIFAGGDIIVFGSLRGSVFAGNRGDETAVIAALKMEPVQIGIAKYLSRSPDKNIDKESHDLRCPEIARIEDGQIVIESFRTI